MDVEPEMPNRSRLQGPIGGLVRLVPESLRRRFRFSRQPAVLKSFQSERAQRRR
jgi:hypothetical protein